MQRVRELMTHEHLETCQPSLSNAFRFSWDGKIAVSFNSSSTMVLTNPPLPLPPPPLSSVLLIAVVILSQVHYLLLFQIILHITIRWQRNGHRLEATYDCSPHWSATTQSIPYILDDFFIVGGATMATAATTASLGKIHLIVGSTLFQTTFGISRPCPWPYEKILVQSFSMPSFWCYFCRLLLSFF